LSVERLIRERGLNAALASITADMNADCPQRDADQLRDRCDVFHPRLVDAFERPG
jgi:hypothetical protein